jgi:hypothetical protein
MTGPTMRQAQPLPCWQEEDGPTRTLRVPRSQWRYARRPRHPGSGGCPPLSPTRTQRPRRCLSLLTRH